MSINYRLSYWGFLFSEEMEAAGAGNIAFKDQRLAFKWIQDNVADFGGSADKVTIWGESAGARSLGMQLIVFMQSTLPLPNAPWRSEAGAWEGREEARKAALIRRCRAMSLSRYIYRQCPRRAGRRSASGPQRVGVCASGHPKGVGGTVHVRCAR